MTSPVKGKIVKGRSVVFVRDSDHCCAFKGQRGKITDIKKKSVTVHLTCGHLLDVHKSFVTPILADLEIR